MLGVLKSPLKRRLEGPYSARWASPTSKGKGDPRLAISSLTDRIFEALVWGVRSS